MNMEQAVIYSRYSPRPKNKALNCPSNEAQIERCAAYCGLKGLDPFDVPVQDRETSGRSTPLFQRDGGITLKHLVGRNKIRHVVCTALDRIFRDTADGLSTLDLWDRQGVTLHLADEGGCTIDVSTGTGRFVATVLLGRARFEADLIAERTSNGMLHRQSRGQRMSDRVPYGYMTNPADPSRLIQCPEEQGHIVEIRALHGQGLTLRGICRELTERGIKCRNNGWRHGLIKRILERDASSRM